MLKLILMELAPLELKTINLIIVENQAVLFRGSLQFNER